MKPVKLRPSGLDQPLLDVVFPILGGTSLVVTAPLLDLLGGYPEFFAIRGLTSTSFWAYLVLLVVGVPLLPISIVGLSSLLGPRFRSVVISGVWSLLGALLVLQVLDRLSLGAPLLVLIGTSLLGAFGLTWLYWFNLTVRRFLSALALSLALLPVLFLLRPGIHELGAASHSQTVDSPEISAEVPVVLVVLDELSSTDLLATEGEINSFRFPNLASLASTGTLFTNAVTVSDSTHLAVPALLTGQFPELGKLPLPRDHPFNLFSLLAGTYKISALEPITRLCPPAINQFRIDSPPRTWTGGATLTDTFIIFLHLVIPAPWSEGLPPIDQSWSGFAANPSDSAADSAQISQSWTHSDFLQGAVKAAKSDRAAELHRFIDSIDSADSQQLLFLHVLLPHVPWRYTPGGKIYASEGGGTVGLENRQWITDEWVVVQAQRRHILQLQFTDLLIGELLDKLRSLELFDRSLIIITSDHGVSFVPGENRRILSARNEVDIVPVPLIIKKPFQREPIVDSRASSLLDIFPTVLDALAMEPPTGVEGRSLLDPENQGSRLRKLLVTGKRVHEFALDMHQKKLLRLARQQQLFGSGKDPSSIYDAGPHAGLLRQLVDRLDVIGDPSTLVELVGDQHSREYKPLSDSSPGHIAGTLYLDDDSFECCDLVVVINGRIEATTTTAPVAPRRHRFSMLVADDRFVEGKNRVEILRLSDSAEGLSLLRPSTRGSKEDGFLVESSRQAVSLVLGGRDFQIVQASDLRGRLDRLSQAESGLRLKGWAADIEMRQPVDTIAVFVGDTYVGRTTPDLRRRDVARQFGDELLHTGFELEVSNDLLPRIRQRGLRAFAVSASASLAKEIRYRCEIQGPRGEAYLISCSNGRVFDVSSGPHWSRLEASPANPSRSNLTVFFIPPEKGWQPESIIAFRDDRYIAVREPTFSQEDAAISTPPEATSYGAVIQLPGRSEPQSSWRLFITGSKNLAIEVHG